jgi:ATP-dependent DNA helicase UvrD/PcrA
LSASPNPFTQGIAGAYRAYETALFANNRTDFAHLQSIVHELLLKPDGSGALVSEIRYVLVDEYQDTNYVQELHAKIGELTLENDDSGRAGLRYLSDS